MASVNHSGIQQVSFDGGQVSKVSEDLILNIKAAAPNSKFKFRVEFWGVHYKSSDKTCLLSFLTQVHKKTNGTINLRMENTGCFGAISSEVPERLQAFLNEKLVPVKSAKPITQGIEKPDKKSAPAEPAKPKTEGTAKYLVLPKKTSAEESLFGTESWLDDYL
ncbi:hypothetical protein JQC92_03715 [Shewanella sp. 202IG2-18]|uniref:hypothetical protein n=1 Tax=Parashewanella hymeniacidonis TaxID=2807618 RepID=UPI00196060FA|nr:hypothetical protein [Parashewanella hymeniacidonis]MBM7071148.1 hypothetical protein [Parashewanella hymeniacidonis]